MAGRPSRRATRRAAVIDSSDEDDMANTTTKHAEDDEEEFAPEEPQAPKTRRTRASRQSSAAPAEAKPAPRGRGRPKRSVEPDTSAATDDSVLQADESANTSNLTQTSAGSSKPAARGRGRPKKSVAPDTTANIEEDTVLEADETADATILSPADPDVTARRPPRKRKSTDRSEEDSDADNTMQPGDGSRQQTPKKRPSIGPDPAATPKAPSTAIRVAVRPTPHSSARSDFPSVAATPLADLNANRMNARLMDQTPATTMAATGTTVRTMNTFMDNPIDIVIKSRNKTTMPTVEPETPKSRIVLTYLILTNFKSYAGRQEVGPFHATFSSVVGPNGSGKSNVIDSLLFVFGFRASKMRQGKISALIHNSAQFPNLDSCEVAVHFHEVMDQPDGTQQIIPDSDLVISRKAFKNNSSKYYINNKESNFTVVTTLLKDRGVDLDHKRFLILQGEVESIAQMKPKAAGEHDDGLLEYLEDIIGTSKYKTPIEEAATEVETLNEVCVEKSGRVQHVEKEKGNLEGKKDIALEYIRTENDIALKKSALYQLYLHQVNDQSKMAQEAITQLQAQLQAELEKHHGSEQVIKDLEKRHEQGNREYEAQHKQAQALAKELAKFEQERVKFDEKRKFLDGKKAKLEKTISNAEKTSAEADDTIEQCNEEIESRSKEIAELEQLVQKEEAELVSIRESLKGKTQAFSEQIAAKQKSLEPWNAKISQKQSAIAVAESELNILQEKANAGVKAREELETKAKSIEDKKNAKAEELQACEEKKSELLEEKEKMHSELAELAATEPKLKTKISNSRQKADEARSSLASTQTRGNVLAALMRMKDSGRIDGFHGRLGNLGIIDPKYDVAISTACGALDNFVTETVDAGQQCIEYLRKNNLGRGNFICLDKMRSRDLSAIQTPENAPRLFDLVKAKADKFRPAFYHALQDTLVANDLAQANRIAYGAKRWRVVTLAGELIDKSGTMSGGGNTVKKGLMSSKLVADTTQEQVAKYEEDRDAWEKKFQEFQDYQRECETRLKELDREIPQLETKMQKIRLEMDSATKNLADIQRRIKEIGKEHSFSSADEDRQQSLEAEVAKLNKDIEKLHGETASVEEEIKSLNDKIMEVGGEKLRTQRAKVDALKEEVTSNSDEISNSEIRRVKAEKQKTKLGKDSAKATKELDVALRDLEKLDDDVNNQGERADELRAQTEEAEAAAAAKKEELKALKAELDEKSDELNETRAVEIEMKNKLEEHQKGLTENRRKQKYWHNELSKLTLHNIEELTGEPELQSNSPQDGEAEGNAEGDADDEEKASDVDMEEARSEQAKSVGDVEMDDAPEGSEDHDAEAEEGDEDDEAEGSGVQDATRRNSKPRASAPTYEFPEYTPDEMQGMRREGLEAEISAFEEKIENVNVDLSVLAEYRRRVEEFAARSADLNSAITQRDSAKKRCDELRRLRLEGFMEGFSAISLRLKEMYQMITMGGNAELELVDSLDPFSEGILFSVMPPKKSWKNISNLSGGEKTLSSLALVFALHHYKPTPLYVMDEIDAALDFRNVSIVANYIKERTKNAQFIVISLRNNMFELAARLVGVYKVNQMTKSVTIENRDYIARPRAAPRQQQLGAGGRGMGDTTTLAMR